MHENERIWTPGGGCASLASPLRSANDKTCLNRIDVEMNEVDLNMQIRKYTKLLINIIVLNKLLI